jgi:hypothetical protein
MIAPSSRGLFDKGGSNASSGRPVLRPSRLVPVPAFNQPASHHIAALHEASMLAVSLPLAVVNGPRCKLARSYGVSLVAESKHSNLETGRVSK